MDKKKHVKTPDSAPGNRRNLVFCSTFLSVSKTPMEFSRFICFLGAVLGPPLSGPQNRRFHTKTLIARSHFQRPDQIEIPGMCEGSLEAPRGFQRLPEAPRSSQKLPEAPKSSEEAPRGSQRLHITVREAILLHFYVVFYGSGFTDNSSRGHFTAFLRGLLWLGLYI